MHRRIIIALILITLLFSQTAISIENSSLTQKKVDEFINELSNPESPMKKPALLSFLAFTGKSGMETKKALEIWSMLQEKFPNLTSAVTQWGEKIEITLPGGDVVMLVAAIEFVDFLLKFWQYQCIQDELRPEVREKVFELLVSNFISIALGGVIGGTVGYLSVGTFFGGVIGVGIGVVAGDLFYEWYYGDTILKLRYIIDQDLGENKNPFTTGAGEYVLGLFEALKDKLSLEI